MNFFYDQPLAPKAQAPRNAKTLVENKQPVCVPARPLFDQK